MHMLGVVQKKIIKNMVTLYNMACNERLNSPAIQHDFQCILFEITGNKEIIIL